jgi:hypothetical protein
MSAQHLPTPWSFESGADNSGDDPDNTLGSIMGAAPLNYHIARVWSDIGAAEANAAFIVRAVNAHDELVAALRDVLRIARAASIGITGNQPRLERARVALAKATGEGA